MERYERFGPAWHLIQLGFTGRRPDECRYKWIHLSGLVDRYSHNSDAQQKLKEGWEPHSSGVWLKFPVEDPGLSTFRRLCAMLPTYPRRFIKRRAGWPEIEAFAVQQGIDEYGPNWEIIANEMHRRNKGQCKRFMEHRHVLCNAIEATRLEEEEPYIYDPNEQ